MCVLVLYRQNIVTVSSRPDYFLILSMNYAMLLFLEASKSICILLIKRLYNVVEWHNYGV